MTYQLYSLTPQPPPNPSPISPPPPDQRPFDPPELSLESIDSTIPPGFPLPSVHSITSQPDNGPSPSRHPLPPITSSRPYPEQRIQPQHSQLQQQQVHYQFIQYGDFPAVALPFTPLRAQSIQFGDHSPIAVPLTTTPHDNNTTIEAKSRKGERDAAQGLLPLTGPPDQGVEWKGWFDVLHPPELPRAPENRPQRVYQQVEISGGFEYPHAQPQLLEQPQFDLTMQLNSQSHLPPPWVQENCAGLGMGMVPGTYILPDRLPTVQQQYRELPLRWEQQCRSLKDKQDQQYHEQPQQPQQLAQERPARPIRPQATSIALLSASRSLNAALNHGVSDAVEMRALGGLEGWELERREKRERIGGEDGGSGVVGD
ncbi:hypothetical protein EX30DRAFT_343195 [Ascodesmis nigricans]|uniref:Uncharacterized protein n=1 Tax=Ascodesmis nigricans TaxID=341454 RepID=A0A4S2MNA6_9PEZI|nr:hypothetical protein EX30DRAFT_343195 [Ascodesmis nigricans]